MQASVPELTSRTISTEGKALQTSRANSTSFSTGAPKLVPPPAAWRKASTTAGWAWPSASGPPGPQIVDIFVAVHVPDAGTLAPGDERRGAAHGPE